MMMLDEDDDNDDYVDDYDDDDDEEEDDDDADDDDDDDEEDDDADDDDDDDDDEEEEDGGGGGGGGGGVGGGGGGGGVDDNGDGDHDHYVRRGGGLKMDGCGSAADNELLITLSTALLPSWFPFCGSLIYPFLLSSVPRPYQADRPRARSAWAAGPVGQPSQAAGQDQQLWSANQWHGAFRLMSHQGLRRGTGSGWGTWALPPPPPPPPLLGKLVHTFVFLYERTHSRRRNAYKNVTFSKFLMHFQPFKGLKFHNFSGPACPRTSLAYEF